MTMRVKWVDDKRIEVNLKQLGIKYKVLTVPMTNIDRKTSMNRQSRLGDKLNEDWVLDYAAKMEAGNPFFMCLLNRYKDDSFIIWSGNHRIGAADLYGEDEIQAYVVDVSDLRLCDVVPRIVNTWEGHATTKEENLINMKWMVEHHSFEIKEAANLCGLKYQVAVEYLRYQKTAEKIAAIGISTNGLSKSILSRMTPISDTNVLRATARFLNREGIVGREAEQFVDDVKSKNTEPSQMAEIARWEEMVKTRKAPKSRKGEGRLPVSQKVREHLLSMLQRLEKLTRGLTTRSQLQLVEELDFQLACKYWKDLKNSIDDALTSHS